MTASQLPSELIAGDTWTWSRSFADYPAGTWTATTYFENKSKTFSVQATASGTDHLFLIAASTTGAYPAGRYAWSVRVTDGTNNYTIEQGSLEVLANPAAAGVRDTRSHARRVLEAIEATIEGRATTDQLSMTVNGRSISRTPIPDLLVMRDKYKWEVANEENAAAVAAGLGSKRRVFVRFGRA